MKEGGRIINFIQRYFCHCTVLLINFHFGFALNVAKKKKCFTTRSTFAPFFYLSHHLNLVTCETDCKAPGLTGLTGLTGVWFTNLYFQLIPNNNIKHVKVLHNNVSSSKCTSKNKSKTNSRASSDSKEERRGKRKRAAVRKQLCHFLSDHLCCDVFLELNSEHIYMTITI